MQVLIDKTNNEVVFTSCTIEYLADIATAKDAEQNIVLILGDMNVNNSRIEETDIVPEDFCGRNYLFENGVFIKK